MGSGARQLCDSLQKFTSNINGYSEKKPANYKSICSMEFFESAVIPGKFPPNWKGDQLTVERGKRDRNCKLHALKRQIWQIMKRLFLPFLFLRLFSSDLFLTCSFGLLSTCHMSSEPSFSLKLLTPFQPSTALRDLWDKSQEEEEWKRERENWVICESHDPRAK